LRTLGKVLNAIKTVLQCERRWLKQVRHEFAMQKVETVWEAWGSFLKYCRVIKARENQRKIAFFLQMQDMVEQKEDRARSIR